VSDYSLDDWVIEVRSPAEGKDFSSSLCGRTRSGVHPTSYPMGTGGPFPRGVKRGVVLTLTTPPHLVPSSRMSRSYIFTLPLGACMAVARLLFTYQCHYAWGRRTRRPMYRDHFVIYCATPYALFNP